MSWPTLVILDSSFAEAQRLRRTLEPFLDGRASVTVRETIGSSCADILLVNDTESCGQAHELRGDLPHVVVAYTLRRSTWQLLAAVPMSATLEIFDSTAVSAFQGALAHLGRSDIKVACTDSGVACDVSGNRCCVSIHADEVDSSGAYDAEVDFPVPAVSSLVEALWWADCLDATGLQALEQYAAQVEVLRIDIQTLLRRAIESRERLKQTVSMTRQVAIQLDESGCVLDASGPVEELLHRETNQLIGFPLRKVSGELDQLRSSGKGSGSLRINGSTLSARILDLGRCGCMPGGLITLALSSDGPRGKPCTDRVNRKLEDIIGSAPPFERVKQLAARIGTNDLPILIIGESGTGKELFAEAIHNLSHRADGPFVPINCAAIPPTLIESELFGYEAGAFTGAERKGRPSLFERANGGTVFLDEVGDMSPQVQAALLRVLEEKVVTRLGGSHAVPIDVRVVAATNRDLDDLVTAGEFRRDLYHRLCVLPMMIPPLRKRAEDIPALVQDILDQLSDRRTVPPDVMHYLMCYRWPGNVRELRHCIEYMTTVSSDELTLDHLPPHIIPHVAITRDHETVDDAHRLAAPSGLSAVGGAELHASDNFILRTVLKANQAGRGVGRRALAEQARAAGLAFSESEIRFRLQILRQNGAVDWHRGRGGARVTSYGRCLLEWEDPT